MSDERTPNTSLERLLEKLDDDPISALERCSTGYSLSAQTHQRRLYDFIAFLCAYVNKLEDNEPEREKLWNAALWKEPITGPIRFRVAILASRHMLGATETKGSLYEQARIYGKVVEYFCNEGVPPTDVPARLKVQGIYKIADVIKKAEDKAAKDEDTDDEDQHVENVLRAIPKKAPVSPTKVSEEENEPELPLVGASRTTNADSRSKANSAQMTKPTKPPIFDIDQDIAIRAHTPVFEKIMGMKKEDILLLKIRCSDGGDPKRFVVIATSRTTLTA